MRDGDTAAVLSGEWETRGWATGHLPLYYPFLRPLPSSSCILISHLISARLFTVAAYDRQSIKFVIGSCKYTKFTVLACAYCNFIGTEA